MEAQRNEWVAGFNQVSSSNETPTCLNLTIYTNDTVSFKKKG